MSADERFARLNGELDRRAYAVAEWG